MKTLLVIVVIILVMVVALIGGYHWDSSRNRGREFGYYREFNRTSNALASIPEVTITKAWHHSDITLEEFSFDLTTSGQSVRLYFGETDPIRSLSRDDAVAVLKKRIEMERYK